jgi:hypothetical protein
LTHCLKFLFFFYLGRATLVGYVTLQLAAMGYGIFCANMLRIGAKNTTPAHPAAMQQLGYY